MVGTGARPPGEKSFNGENQIVLCPQFLNSEEIIGPFAPPNTIPTPTTNVYRQQGIQTQNCIALPLSVSAVLGN